MIPRVAAVVLVLTLAACSGSGSGGGAGGVATTDAPMDFVETADVLASLAYGAGYSADELENVRTFLARMIGACPDIAGPEAVADKVAGLAETLEPAGDPETYRGVMDAMEASAVDGSC